MDALNPLGFYTQKTFPDNQKEALKQDYLAGIGVSELITKYRFTNHYALTLTIRNMGLPPRVAGRRIGPKFDINPEKEEQIVRMYKEGQSRSKIIETIGMKLNGASHKKLREVLLKHGLINSAEASTRKYNKRSPQTVLPPAEDYLTLSLGGVTVILDIPPTILLKGASVNADTITLKLR